MAVGMIKTCEKCGKSYDEGRGEHFVCNPWNVAQVNAKKFLFEQGYGSRLETQIPMSSVIDLLAKYQKEKP